MQTIIPIGPHDREPGIAHRRAIVALYEERRAAGMPAPTFREIQASTGLLSSDSVQFHINKLHERKVLNKQGRRYSLAVVASVAEVANG